jgi:hypothetical protein
MDGQVGVDNRDLAIRNMAVVHKAQRTGNEVDACNNNGRPACGTPAEQRLLDLVLNLNLSLNLNLNLALTSSTST